MHRPISFALVLAAALLSLAPALAAQTQTPQWQPFASSADGFRAMFPSQPEVSKNNVPVGSDTFELRSYVSESGATALYIGVCDYGPKAVAADPDEMLASAKKAAVDHMGAHILTEKQITQDAHHGVEFEAESDKLHFSVRMVMDGGVLYQVMVASPLDQRFANAVRFLDSFQLLPRQRTESSAPAAPVPDWKPYRYPSDGFSASFPSPPNLQKQTVSTDAGAFELRTYATQDSSAALTVAVCDYGASAAGKDPDSLLESAEKGAISNLKAHLLTEKKIALGTYHGVEFDTDSDTTHISARLYLVGTVLYQTLVASPLHIQFDDGTRFLDSFQLLPRTASN